jgi:hypothetical protein
LKTYKENKSKLNDIMTTPNASTNGQILSFSWKKFPLEERHFYICLVEKENKEKSESESFNNLYEYIKIIFPSNGKGTKIVKYPECEKNWITSHSCFQTTGGVNSYGSSSHMIVRGSLEDIPENVFTNSGIIIFESLEDTNRYIQRRHGYTLDNFDTSLNFILIDKLSVGHFNIYGLLKKDLTRYNKAFLPAP